jgi:hypothetical protein
MRMSGPITIHRSEFSRRTDRTNETNPATVLEAVKKADRGSAALRVHVNIPGGSLF